MAVFHASPLSEEEFMPMEEQQRSSRRIMGCLFAISSWAIAGFSASPIAIAQVENTVDVGGHRLFYQLHGQGTPTVVIDVGVGESFQSCLPLVSELSKTVSVLVYDRVGYGRSEIGPMPRDAKAEAADLKALLQKAKLNGPYVLVGHSLGGLNMQVFAHEYAENVRGLVLLAPPPRSWLEARTWSRSTMP